jgi:hypothetical protein
MTSKDPPKQQQPPTIDAAKSAYWHAAANGFMGFFSHLHSTWYGPEALQYRFERETLSRYVQPFYWGMGASVFLFVNFRVTGSTRFLKLRQEWWNNQRRRPQQPQQPATTPTKLPSNTNTNPEKEWTSHLEKQRNEKQQNALRSIKALTDILVSLSVGTSSIFILLDAEKETMRQDFEQAPLTMGKSLVADTMCHELVETSHQLFGSSRPPLVDDDANFTTFTQLVANCQLRQQEETKLRKELGIPMTSEEPVSIPYPGLKQLSKPSSNR